MDALDGDVERIYRDANLDFRPRFYPVFRFVETHGSAGLRAIAEATCLSHSAVSQTVHELRRAGLVKVVRGADRRARDVSLTAKGQMLLPRLHAVWAAVEAASRELDQELPEPLTAVVDVALMALGAHRFSARVQRHLSVEVAG